MWLKGFEALIGWFSDVPIMRCITRVIEKLFFCIYTSQVKVTCGVT